MSRWTDLALWVGPTVNEGDGDSTPGELADHFREPSRGLVLHIMEGTLDGSVQWGRNPASRVSFHFGNGKDGRLVQLVDTDDRAWTQVAGNGGWHSVENEGHSGDLLTPAQLENVAQLYARGVREYGWPLQATDSTSGRGLGWHGMGGDAWGGHFDCPGQPIKDQRAAILARATELVGGDDMFAQYGDNNGKVWVMQMDVREVLSAKGVALPETWADGKYGNDTAAKLLQAVAPFVGGDATGHTFGPGEYRALRDTLSSIRATRYAAAATLVQHHHDVTITGQAGRAIAG